MVIVGLWLALFGASSALGVSTIKKGGKFPDKPLAVPDNPDHRTYLGLPEGDSFRVPQIEADVVLVEIFSMYCPACQREAPRVNELYRLIEEDDKLRGKVKVIGIGAGNTPFEVNVFRKKYKVPFPLFADGDFSIHKSLGEVRTPYFIGVKIKKDGTHEIFDTKLGGFEKADDFLASLLKSSGLN
jgi:peroxiredoxin